MLNFVTTFFGTFCYSGFFPFAPATFASLVFLALYAVVPGGEWLAHPVVAVVTLVMSVPIATHLEKRYGHDAGRIVIDEIVGLQLVLVWAQPTLLGLAAVFFLFRVFDIAKPFPARQAQGLPVGYGVVCDDFVAGLYTRLAIIVIGMWFPGMGDFL